MHEIVSTPAWGAKTAPHFTLNLKEEKVMPNIFTTVGELLFYIFLGRAFVSLKSLKTDKHYTFRVLRAVKKSNIYWVSVKGPYNRLYYMGYIINCKKFFLSDKSLYKRGSGPYKALTYLLGILWQSTTIPSVIEIYRENRCGRCRKSLTDPISIERGIGPECYKKINFQGIM
jgi:hypothetical protein